MDKEPLIIKSGAGHKVEIEQGSTHAKGRRNLVASGEDALPDHMVKEGLTEERKEIDLSAAAEEAQAPAAQDKAAAAETPALKKPMTDSEEPEPETSTQTEFPVLDPIEAPTGAQGPSVQREVLGDQDATTEKAEVVGDRFLGGQDGAAAEEELVSEPESHALTNRQKIEQLQASANKILIDQAQRPLKTLDIEPQTREAGAVESDSHTETLEQSAASDEPPSVDNVVSVAATDDLPPELAGNVGFTPVAKESPDSAFLARVRALRNNMSVTDHRLAELQVKPPVKP
jgi:hypothetical protein